MHLRFKPNFDVSKLTWSRPDSRIAPLCSNCFGPVSEAPLMMWTDEGACVQLCDECVEKIIEVVE